MSRTPNGVMCGDSGGTRTDGEPCTRMCKVGFTRCNLHGGGSPAARIKAEQMLSQARLPACEALYTIIEDWQRKTCTACGFPSADNDVTRTIIRACQVILDRTGLGPHATLDIAKQSDGELNIDMMTDGERDELRGLIGQMKTLKEAVRLRMYPQASSIM